MGASSAAAADIDSTDQPAPTARAQSTEETRRRVVRSARSAFASLGYTGASMRRIADEAGLSPMALYTYAPSKAALFQLVYEDGITRIYAEFAEVVAGQDTLVDELDALLERGGDLLMREPDLLRFTTRMVSDHVHADLVDQELLTEPYRQFFHDLAHRAIRRGEIGADDGARVVGFVTMLLWGLTSMAGLDPNGVRDAVAAAKWAIRGRLAG